MATFAPLNLLRRAPGPIALKHLVLVPQWGMTNRLQAIASARYVCASVSAKCTVVWNWGKFEDYFAPMPDVEVIESAQSIKTERVVLHQMIPSLNRTVDVTAKDILLHSNCWFSGSHDKRSEDWFSGGHSQDYAGYWNFITKIKPFIPKLSPRLQRIVDDFKAQHLSHAVGFHMRRTDHKPARHSPDHLFTSYAREVIDDGFKIFLSSDNTATEKMMREKFGDSIVIYPKRPEIADRWPRFEDTITAEEGLIDFYLLAGTDHVVGTVGSTFSETAFLLNGSPKCRFMKLEDNSVRARSLEMIRRSGFIARGLIDRRWYIDVRRFKHEIQQRFETLKS